jgi:hypothetical protein
MKFAVKGLSILVAAALVVGAVAATPASAGGKRKCTLESEITKILSFDWLRHKG